MLTVPVMTHSRGMVRANDVCILKNEVRKFQKSIKFPWTDDCKIVI